MGISVKHPFRNGKVPVRGQARVSMVVIGSVMCYVRAIWRYLRAKTAEEIDQKPRVLPSGGSVFSFFSPFFCPLFTPRYQFYAVGC
jgi:hypothetical protein